MIYLIFILMLIVNFNNLLQRRMSLEKNQMEGATVVDNVISILRDSDGFLEEAFKIPIYINETKTWIWFYGFNMKPHETYISHYDSEALLVCKKGSVTIESCIVGHLHTSPCNLSISAGRLAKITGFGKFSITAGAERAMVVLVRFVAKDAKPTVATVKEIEGPSLNNIDHTFLNYAGKEDWHSTNIWRVGEESKFGGFENYVFVKIQVIDGPLNDFTSAPFVIIKLKEKLGWTVQLNAKKGRLDMVIPTLKAAPMAVVAAKDDKLHVQIYETPDKRTRIDHNEFAKRDGGLPHGVIPFEIHEAASQLVTVYEGSLLVTLEGVTPKDDEVELTPMRNPSVFIAIGQRHKIEQNTPMLTRFTSIYEKSVK